MNVFLLARKIILYLVLCLPLGAVLQAQGVIDKQIVAGGFITIDLTLDLGAATISPLPTLGEAAWSVGGTSIQTNGGVNTLKYEAYHSDRTEPKLDSFTVTHGLPANRKTILIRVLVTPHVTIARPDFETVRNNSTVSISPLLNDSITTGIAALDTNFVLSTNFGSAIFLNNTQIVFDPQGNTGIAYINYVVCNSNNVCDLGTITVTSYDEAALVSDTMNIITTKNNPQLILLPMLDFEVDASPSIGEVELVSNVWTYTPDENIVGRDTLVFTKVINGTVIYKTVFINIIDVPYENKYLKDDYAFTAVGESKEIEYLENDAEVAELENFSFGQPRYGTLIADSTGSGLVSYTPNGNFTGVDYFTYTALHSSGQEETATIYVTVSDYKPSAFRFSLSTPKNHPLVIQYGIPIPFDRFEVTIDGELGHATFEESYEANGTVLEKVILYTPFTNVTGIDEFEIQYCVSANKCSTIKIKMEILDVEVSEENECIAEGCVWAGDTNQDGVVNVKDLLPIGLFMGEQGNNRPSPDFSAWYGQYGEDWRNPYYNSKVDLKHSDADGNGIVTATDTFAIHDFYGKTHSITPAPVQNTHPLPIFFGRQEVIPIVGPGTRIEIPIYLGDEAYVAYDIYGIAIDQILYNPALVEPGSVKLEFLQDSWLAYNAPTLKMVREQTAGKLEAAFTRTNGLAASGYGKIGRLSFIVIDDLDGFRPDANAQLTFSISASTANGVGQVFTLPGDNITFQLDLSEPTEEKIAQAVTPDQLQLYPNPTNDVVNLYLNGYQEVEQFEVYDLTGRRVYESGKVFARAAQVQVSNWVSGIYILKAKTTGGSVVNKKFEVLR